MNSQPKTTKRGKVLVYLIGSLGDTIVAIPALRAVRRHFAEAEIVVLQNAGSEGVVEASDVIPSELVNRYITYENSSKPISKISAFPGLWSKIRRERFQAAVYLVISERPESSVRRDKLFFRSCGIRELIGFHAFSKEQLFPLDQTGHPAVTPHEALRKLDRIQRDGVSVSKTDDLQRPFFTFSENEIEKIGTWISAERMRPASTLVAVAPGCKTQANLWPVERFINVCRGVLANGDCEIIIVGGPAENPLGERIVGELACGINAAGKFGVRDSAILLSLCDFYLGLDTGTTHLADAVGLPTIGIYGERNNPGQWFPLGEESEVVSHPVACAGCRLFECPIPDHPCMNGITADSVLLRFQEFMQKHTGQYRLRERAERTLD